MGYRYFESIKITALTPKIAPIKEKGIRYLIKSQFIFPERANLKALPLLEKKAASLFRCV